MKETLQASRYNPLVSVITISYNSEDFIEQTIESVLSQDYPDIEYVVVDAASTDNTLKIIEKYKDRISKFVSEPDDGRYDGYNKGVRLSTGEIIGMINSDDYYADSTAVRRVVEAFRQNPEAKVVYGVVDFVERDTERVIMKWGKDAEPREIRKRMYMPHPSVFAKREVYDNAGLLRKEYSLALDYEWAIRVVKYTRPYFLDYRIAIMRDMGGSGSYYRATLAEAARALREHGYYWDYFLTLIKNFIKIMLTVFGFRDVIYRIWAKNARPRG
ncbi:MAG: glycosyltransferase family 2 protein [Thermodesulfovibrionales bacterium]|nr:glycosyltransferase family 2 protein [Thermodesulfovibrionales bacterium]